jgi:two-component system chemotaxis response regulator CheB
MSRGDSPATQPKRVVGVGASAGGVEALSMLVRSIPADIQAVILVVLHMPPDAESRLAEILGRAGLLPSSNAEHGRKLEAGRIFVAPPDRHLIVSGGDMWLVDGPRENSVRPSVDPLLRSIASTYGPRGVGLVLSGAQDDGAVGMAAIHAAGGTTIVQEPDEALAPGMPLAAMANTQVDHVLRVADIGPLLARIADSEPGSEPTAYDNPAAEIDEGPSDLSCPDCGGVLRMRRSSGLPYFRCRTGHGYSPESLISAQSGTLEGALYTALRVLEEQASVSGRLARQMQDRGMGHVARRFLIRQREAAERADVIRAAIETVETPQTPVDAPSERPEPDEQLRAVASGRS